MPAGTAVVVQTAAQRHLGLNDAWDRTVSLAMLDAGLVAPRPPAAPLKPTDAADTDAAHVGRRAARHRALAEAAAEAEAAPPQRLAHPCLPPGFLDPAFERTVRLEREPVHAGAIALSGGDASAADGGAACAVEVARLFDTPDASCPVLHACGAHSPYRRASCDGCVSMCSIQPS